MTNDIKPQHVEQRGRCRVCRRALKNPKWAEIGIGPVCARRTAGMLTGSTVADRPGLRARFDIVRSDAESITIRDRVEDHACSVTNDAEAVVAEMTALGLGKRRLFYFDSMGNRDEILHEAGKFAGFKAGPRTVSQGEQPC